MPAHFLKYDLRELVKCKRCGRYEYWGKMAYIGSKTYCRNCYSLKQYDKEYEYDEDEQQELCRD